MLVWSLLTVARHALSPLQMRVHKAASPLLERRQAERAILFVPKTSALTMAALRYRACEANCRFSDIPVLAQCDIV
jgi:hypothetical protein